MIHRSLAALAWAYLATLLAWLVAYLVLGDRLAYFGMFNLVAVYLFFPLPLVFLVAALNRPSRLWIGAALGLLAFLWLWGALFIPGRGRLGTRGPELTVMTYNVLAWHDYTQPVIDTILAENADVVFLQELTHNLAGRVQADLSAQYPYQILEPVDSPSGIGVLSKYPLRRTGARLPDRWVGGPLLLEMDWNGHPVQLVDFHMLPTTSPRSQGAMASDFRTRQGQARKLVEYTRGRGPAILGGDANAGPLSEAVHIFTREFRDSWREAGFGPGHTFPSRTLDESNRPKIGRWDIPPRVARIDYIFHSSEWTAVEARLARYDGVSDHRGVVAVLLLH